MNLVVLTAALSSLNAGLYSTGRIMHSMSMAGSAPRFAGRMNRAGVPYGGIALTAVVTLIGVGLNVVVPDEAFEIVLNVACLGIIGAWATIVLCQLRLVSWARNGLLRRPAFRLFGGPYTSWLVLIFLAGVLVLIGLDYQVGIFTIGSLGVPDPPAGHRLVRLPGPHRRHRRAAIQRHRRVPDRGRPAVHRTASAGR